MRPWRGLTHITLWSTDLCGTSLQAPLPLPQQSWTGSLLPKCRKVICPVSLQSRVLRCQPLWLSIAYDKQPGHKGSRNPTRYLGKRGSLPHRYTNRTQEQDEADKRSCQGLSLSLTHQEQGRGAQSTTEGTGGFG